MLLLPFVSAAIRLIAFKNALALASMLSVEDGSAAIDLAIVLHLGRALRPGHPFQKKRLTLWNAEVLTNHRDTGRLFDARNMASDRAVAAGHGWPSSAHRRGADAGSLPEPGRGRNSLCRRPASASEMAWNLPSSNQGGPNIGIVDFLLLVGQHF